MVAANGGIPVSIPRWIHECVASDALLTLIGKRVSFRWPPGSDNWGHTDRNGGVIALALAVCRNSDMAKAVSKLFARPEEQSLFWDAASVAAVLAGPGVPSQMRRDIKKCISVQKKSSDLKILDSKH